MELVKKNIHTERIKAKALLQIPLEEDINVSDSRPDVGKPVFTRGKIKVDEVKSGTNKADLCIRFCILQKEKTPG